MSVPNGILTVVGRTVVVRDAVWGDLELEAPLVELLDTPEVQRLRGVRQLGMAHLVYPSANHTRFEHGLGTCHLAGRILQALGRAGHRIEPAEALAIRAAALVHDVGHVPCGHTFEDERRIFPRHDDPARTRRFLGDTALGAALRRLGLHAQVLAAMGASEGGIAVAKDVVSGTVCADLLDYLARDALFTGIRRGWDERLLRYLGLEDGRLVLRLHQRGLPREDAVSEVVHLLRLRHALTERVYFHHAKVAAGALVSKMVERAVAHGLQLEHLFGLGDEGLLGLLAREHAPRDPVVARLLGDLAARRLPKRAYVLTRRVDPAVQAALVRRFHADRAERERVEAELEAELGLDAGSVILYCPAPEVSLKEACVLVDPGRGGVRPLHALGLPEVAVLGERHRDLWRFYAFLAGEASAGARAALAGACAARFGAESELST